MSLVELWQTGIVSGFETLYSRYKDMVFRTALSMTGNVHEAEDILQMTFIRVYKARDKFKGDENALKRWLYRVTINQCLDFHRKKKSRSLGYSLDRMMENGFQPRVEFSNSKQEVEEMVYLAVGCLDDKHRSAVTLRYFEGLPNEEIAKILNIPLGTVKSRLNTAMKMMRQRLVKEK
ncbi:MAG TPA: RNA polymerase sigma factor [Dehalococcoidales bacterium]|nr:RNA polymerase sigma factor [Dehalococcoidales bacterium]